jgi:hypothetical protein
MQLRSGHDACSWPLNAARAGVLRIGLSVLAALLLCLQALLSSEGRT